MTDGHRSVRELLGSYALGHLEGSEQITVAAHLDTCVSCRAELAGLTPLAGRLAGVDADRVEGTPGPPPELADRVLDRVRAERRATRHFPRRGVLVAAAAVVVAGAAGFALGTTRDGVPLEPVSVQALDADLAAEAGLVPHTWGMEIKLDGTGFDPGTAYRVTVRDEQGREVGAGEFLGTGPSELHCNLNSSVLRDDATGFTVRDDQGTAVLAARLP
ncbi:MAG: zf-HC2 domain-containing protein [Actinomycetota bacterium]|nr:zf-HC2 domain-containing protein [Actinomycetota bacterium]